MAHFYASNFGNRIFLQRSQPTMIQTGNDIPQANIQTPTAAGISVIQYSHFNIGNRGAILNNSHRNVQAQLGDWI